MQASVARGEIFLPHWGLVGGAFGQSFWGPIDWASEYGLLEMAHAVMSGKAPEFPWPESVVGGQDPFDPTKRIFDTHFMFLGLTELTNKSESYPWDALSISKLSSTKHPRPVGITCGISTHDLLDTCQFCWYLVRKIGVAQAVPLPAGYERISAIEATLATVLYYQKTGVMLASGRPWLTRTVCQGGPIVVSSDRANTTITVATIDDPDFCLQGVKRVYGK